MMKIPSPSPCPCCHSPAHLLRIHDEVLVECTHPDCKGPDREAADDCDACFTLEAALAQWERVVAWTLARDAA